MSSGRVLVLSHPELAGYLKIVATGGEEPSGEEGGITTGSQCKPVFHIIVGRPGEVSRRAWHELRHCGGKAGWLRCPAEFAITTLLRVAVQAAEEEKYTASVRSGPTARLGETAALVSPASLHRIREVEPMEGDLAGYHVKGAGQGLAIDGPAGTEMCSACRNCVPPGAPRCTQCGARLIRFEQATDQFSASATQHEPFE